jgi:hypothetical protein
VRIRIRRLALDGSAAGRENEIAAAVRSALGQRLAAFGGATRERAALVRGEAAARQIETRVSSALRGGRP